MSKPIPISHIIHISSPDALRAGTVVALDLADDKAAVQIAQKIADATGRRVVIRDADMIEIGVISAAPTQ